MLLQKLPQLTGPSSWTLLHLTGTTRMSGTPLEAVYAGNGTNFPYLRDLVFRAAAVRVLARPPTPWQLIAELKAAALGVDLLLAELPPAWAMLLNITGQIRFPAWVRQELDLPARQTGWLLPRHIEREADRYIRRNGYTVRFAASEADYRQFYHELHRPYMQSRFGDAAVVHPENVFLERCRGHTLAILEADGRRLAAVLLKRHGHRLEIGWFGCVSTPPPPGASQVLDVVCIRRAYQSGARRIVLGDSRPSLTDGVVRYKMRFGARIVPTRFPQPRLVIAVSKWTTDLAECLDRERLLTVRRRTVHVCRVGGPLPDVRMRLEPIRTV